MGTKILSVPILLTLTCLANAQAPDVQAARPTTAPVSESRPTRGTRDAKVAIVLFDDFACPHSAYMYRTIVEDALVRYGDNVSLVLADVPNSSIHPWAKRAAIIAGCLGQQSESAYWKFADYVHANQSSINKAELERLANEQAAAGGIAVGALQQCLEAAPDQHIKAGYKQATELGVTGVPTLIINGEKIVGSVPPTTIYAAIDRALLNTSTNKAASSQITPPPQQR